MSFDVDTVRNTFPMFKDRNEPLHYLDNAATGQICAAAADALMAFETRQRANVKRGVYSLADAATQAFEEARQRVARYVNAPHADEIVFTSGCTAGINMLASSLGQNLQEGDEILLTHLEHHSNIVPWQLVAEPRGAIVRALPVDDDGRLDLDALDDYVTERTCIVAATHVSNVTGAVTDVGRLCAAASGVEALLILDGAQQAPHGPIDVQALGCDFYVLSGHKMFGSTGAGAVWGRGELLEALPPFLGGGEMIQEVRFDGTTFAAPPHRFEAGTPPIGPALAMGAAADYLHHLDWTKISEHERSLTAKIIEGLDAVEGASIFGPKKLDNRLGVVSFEIEGLHAHDVCQMLDSFHVCLRGGHHCAQPLMQSFGLTATTRASLAFYNNEADIEALFKGLDQTIAQLR
ncbi:MAG: SufS family cysteine desulfurase [Pseudomonadota bacterium]